MIIRKSVVNKLVSELMKFQMFPDLWITGIFKNQIPIYDIVK